MLINEFKQDIPFMPYLNTGTMIDLATGSFQPGADGRWVINGGLSVITAITGRAQTYKSGTAGTMLGRVLNLHPQAGAFLIESEGSMSDATRIDDFVPDNKPVSDRIAFYPATTTLGQVDKMIKDLSKKKLENKKDLMIDSPFLNPKTGKPYKMWIPTFVFNDSFSRLRSENADKIMDETTADHKDSNMMWMTDGNAKSKFMTTLGRRCLNAGIYMIMTGHVGDNQSLTPYAAPKQLQYMKGTDKIKGVGSQFEFLATTLIQTLAAETLLHKSSNSCMFPTKHSTRIEVNKITATMVRGKNNATGYNLEMVVSQYQGILDSVTYHNFLNSHGNYGLTIKGNNERFAPKLLSDTEASDFYHRKTLRERADNEYELVRALELLAHLCFIQNYWNTRKFPDYILLTPEEFAEKLKNSDKGIISRVLNSTSAWGTDPKPERERLTILDVLALVTNPKA